MASPCQQKKIFITQICEQTNSGAVLGYFGSRTLQHVDCSSWAWSKPLTTPPPEPLLPYIQQILNSQSLKYLDLCSRLGGSFLCPLKRQSGHTGWSLRFQLEDRAAPPQDFLTAKIMKHTSEHFSNLHSSWNSQKATQPITCVKMETENNLTGNFWPAISVGEVCRGGGCRSPWETRYCSKLTRAAQESAQVWRWTTLLEQRSSKSGCSCETHRKRHMLSLSHLLPLQSFTITLVKQLKLPCWRCCGF